MVKTMVSGWFSPTNQSSDNQRANSNGPSAGSQWVLVLLRRLHPQHFSGAVVGWAHFLPPENQRMTYSMDWFKGKFEPETMVFTIKCGVFRLKLPPKPIHWHTLIIHPHQSIGSITMLRYIPTILGCPIISNGIIIRSSDDCYPKWALYTLIVMNYPLYHWLSNLYIKILVHNVGHILIWRFDNQLYSIFWLSPIKMVYCTPIYCMFLLFPIFISDLVIVCP